MNSLLRKRLGRVTLLLATCAAALSGGSGDARAETLPQRLSQTGLFAAGSSSEIDAKNLAYAPQYPLWSDGAKKRRWLRLPPGARIDATRSEAWKFPPGTRFWKEFSFEKRVETRYIEVSEDGSFRFASYVWDEARGDAFLAPSEGVRVSGYQVPSISDCRACHEGRSSHVLGFGALQLSPDRDVNAAHSETPPPGAVNLNELARRGLFQNLDPRLLERSPRIEANSAIARAAAGYLFANCAHCHNAEGPLTSLGLDLDQAPLERDGAERMERSLMRFGRFRLPNEQRSSLLSPGHAPRSSLWFRLRSREAALQMPPLGTKLVDRDAVALIARWISSVRSFRSVAKDTAP